jgi:hypothetical protein
VNCTGSESCGLGIVCHHDDRFTGITR